MNTFNVRTMQYLCCVLLAALAPHAALAGGMDTGAGTNDLPFHIQGSQVMDMSKSGLVINATATLGAACGNIPGTNTPVAIGTLAQDGTGKYLSCQSRNGQTPGTWNSAFASSNVGWISVTADLLDWIGPEIWYHQSPTEACQSAGYTDMTGLIKYVYYYAAGTTVSTPRGSPGDDYGRFSAAETSGLGARQLSPGAVSSPTGEWWEWSVGNFSPDGTVQIACYK